MSNDQKYVIRYYDKRYNKQKEEYTDKYIANERFRALQGLQNNPWWEGAKPEVTQ